MTSLILFHGSNNIIKQPLFGGSRDHNDYGKGFYCTEHVDMAKEWAVSGRRNGYANSYKINDAGLATLNLNGPEYGILHWLSVLLQNRVFDIAAPLPLEARAYIIEQFPVPYEQADIIRGYRADDAYFSYAQDFLNGLISLRQLSHAMHLGELGEQVVIKSKAAFDRLRFISAEHALAEEWYPLREARDTQARRSYFDVDRNRRQKGDIFILQILDEEMGPDDPRLR